MFNDIKFFMNKSRNTCLQNKLVKIIEIYMKYNI